MKSPKWLRTGVCKLRGGEFFCLSAWTRFECLTCEYVTGSAKNTCYLKFYINFCILSERSAPAVDSVTSFFSNCRGAEASAMWLDQRATYPTVWLITGFYLYSFTYSPVTVLSWFYSKSVSLFFPGRTRQHRLTSYCRRSTTHGKSDIRTDKPPG